MRLALHPKNTLVSTKLPTWWHPSYLYILNKCIIFANFRNNWGNRQQNHWLWITQIWWRSLSVTYLILYLLIRYSGFILMKRHLTTDTMLMNSNKISPWYTLWGFKLSWTWGKLVSLHCFLYCWHPSARCGLKGGHFHMDTCIHTHWSLQQRSLKKVAWPKITAKCNTYRVCE